MDELDRSNKISQFIGAHTLIFRVMYRVLYHSPAIVFNIVKMICVIQQSFMRRLELYMGWNITVVRLIDVLNSEIKRIDDDRNNNKPKDYEGKDYIIMGAFFIFFILTFTAVVYFTSDHLYRGIYDHFEL
jgi:hypothetical protein